MSWNVRALPGMGGVFSLSLAPPWFAALSVLPWRAMVSRVARTPGFPVSGVSATRAVVSLWAWRAVSSSVST